MFFLWFLGVWAPRPLNVLPKTPPGINRRSPKVIFWSFGGVWAHSPRAQLGFVGRMCGKFYVSTMYCILCTLLYTIYYMPYNIQYARYVFDDFCFKARGENLRWVPPACLLGVSWAPPGVPPGCSWVPPEPHWLSALIQRQPDCMHGCLAQLCTMAHLCSLALRANFLAHYDSLILCTPCGPFECAL